MRKNTKKQWRQLDNKQFKAATKAKIIDFSPDLN